MYMIVKLIPQEKHRGKTEDFFTVFIEEEHVIGSRRLGANEFVIKRVGNVKKRGGPEPNVGRGAVGIELSEAVGNAIGHHWSDGNLMAFVQGQLIGELRQFA